MDCAACKLHIHHNMQATWVEVASMHNSLFIIYIVWVLVDMIYVTKLESKSSIILFIQFFLLQSKDGEPFGSPLDTCYSKICSGANHGCKISQ